MIVGIVGAEAAKFTPETESKARLLIEQLLTRPGVIGYSSGHCHLGGVDIWTEEIGDKFWLEPRIFPPACLSWEAGYKPRNIRIARASDELHCITVRELPWNYTGMRFSECYHCHTRDHVKSGGCWTAHYAKKLGKPVFWHVL